MTEFVNVNLPLSDNQSFSVIVRLQPISVAQSSSVTLVERKRKNEEENYCDDDADDDSSFEIRADVDRNIDYSNRRQEIDEMSKILQHRREDLKIKANCEALMRYPTSDYLIDYLIDNITNNVIRKASMKDSTRMNRYEEQLGSVYLILKYLSVDSNQYLRKNLADYDSKLLNIFDKYVTKAENYALNKTKDEVAALVFVQLEKYLQKLDIEITKKNESQVKRTRKAAEKFNILQEAKPVFSDIGKLNGKLCIICEDIPRQICCAPCGHVVLCKTCSAKVNDCPICRTKITQKLAFIVS